MPVFCAISLVVLDGSKSISYTIISCISDSSFTPPFTPICSTESVSFTNSGWQGMSIRKYVLSSSVSIVALGEPLVKAIRYVFFAVAIVQYHSLSLPNSRPCRLRCDGCDYSFTTLWYSNRRHPLLVHILQPIPY